MAFMTDKEGEKIYYETWPVESPRAVIQILTGLGEIAWYYEELAQEANRHGLSVWLHEYRKHGRSEAKYGQENIFLTFAADAAQLLSMIREETPDKKVFLVCHSLGTGIGQGEVGFYCLPPVHKSGLQQPVLSRFSADAGRDAGRAVTGGTG